MKENKIYKQYWLAKCPEGNIDSNGTVFGTIQLTDGSHDSKEGVTKAIKIIEGIGLKSEGYRYFMATVEEIPYINVKVNEDAINSCKSMLNNSY